MESNIPLKHLGWLNSTIMKSLSVLKCMPCECRGARAPHPASETVAPSEGEVAGEAPGARRARAIISDMHAEKDQASRSCGGSCASAISSPNATTNFMPLSATCKIEVNEFSHPFFNSFTRANSLQHFQRRKKRYLHEAASHIILQHIFCQRMGKCFFFVHIKVQQVGQPVSGS